MGRLVYPVQRLSCIAWLTRPNLGRRRSEIGRDLSERADLSPEKYCTKWYGPSAMRVFKTRAFCRLMKRSALTDSALWTAVLEMSQGLVDADLGGHVVKQRIAVAGQGKRGGARTIVATKLAERWFFLYGFN